MRKFFKMVKLSIYKFILESFGKVVFIPDTTSSFDWETMETVSGDYKSGLN